MRVIKATGHTERFNRHKLIRSLMKSGLSRHQAKKTAQEIIQRQPKRETTTEQIFRDTRTILRRTEPVAELRYNLKRALMELGPTGFPFERLLGKMMEAYGYKAVTGVVVNGYCVQHEVDVIAKKGDHEVFIEAKYHNRPGRKSEVGVLLYSHARFTDIAKAHRERGSKSKHEGWVVTNTQCTTEAIKYSRCSGVKIISWAYPTGKALKELLEAKKLYPITVMASLPHQAKERLLNGNVVMLSDFIAKSAGQLAGITGLARDKVERLQTTARQLAAD